MCTGIVALHPSTRCFACSWLLCLAGASGPVFVQCVRACVHATLPLSLSTHTHARTHTQHTYMIHKERALLLTLGDTSSPLRMTRRDRAEARCEQIGVHTNKVRGVIQLLLAQQVHLRV